jgi:hypothetical protein
MSKNPIAAWLLGLLLCASLADAARLENVRSFQHDRFTRVVFDVSDSVDYRISRQLEKGFVDLILQGDLGRRMSQEKAINKGGVLKAKQLRKTSTSLTWRLSCENIERVSTMALNEEPYKVVLDFYKTSPTTVVPAKVVKKSNPAKRSTTKKLDKPAPKKETSKNTPPKTVKQLAPMKTKGLRNAESYRFIIAENFLLLKDTLSAQKQLLLVQEENATHSWTRVLLALCYRSQGDLYRARALAEPLISNTNVGTLARSIVGSLTTAPGTELPGGEMDSDDMEAYISMLRRGRNLDANDLYSEPVAVPPSGGSSGMAPGFGIGVILMAALWFFVNNKNKQKAEKKTRKRILAASSKEPEKKIPEDFATVSREASEELERQLKGLDEEKTDGWPEASSIEPEASPDSIEAQVYALADQENSIVEIAEDLNMGVDEVRLVLELREQNREG